MKELDFRIVGAFLWDKAGVPRKATEEEKQLWADRLRLLAKIEELQPVPDCKHEKCRIFNKGLKNETTQCIICGDYVTPNVHSVQDKRTTSKGWNCLPTT